MVNETDTAEFMTSARGQRALSDAAGLHSDGLETLPALSRLRKTWTPDEAAACWEMTVLRDKAQSKFGVDAQRMLFTREALEQASGMRTSAHHASVFVSRGFSAVSDLCGGIGGDALAFARSGLRVVVYERDPARSLYAEFNLRALSVDHMASVVTADVTECTLSPGPVWIDPARRAGGKRVQSTEDYLPPLSWCRRQAQEMGTVWGVKVSPAIPHALAQDTNSALEFVSDDGECKECVLWMGTNTAPGTVTATILTASGTHELHGVPDSKPLPLGTGTTLYEPDAAIIRAHLVGTLGTMLNASPVDPHIAYLLGEDFVPSPFASAYHVLDRFAWSRRRLQETLNARNAGRVVIKKRGFPQEPDTVRGQLKLTGTAEVVVVLTRCGTGHDVFLCQPIS